MLNPVYFDDRDTKRMEREEKFKRKKASRSEYVEELRKEMYDLPEERTGLIQTGSRQAFLREEKQLEDTEMEHYKRKQLTAADKKKWRN